MTTLLQPADRLDDGAVWRLPRGASLTLSIGPDERRLRVREGRLWLTAAGRDATSLPEDVWLAAGDDVRLTAGTSVVAEGWPQASFELMVPPVKGPSRPAGRLAGWLAARLGR